MAKRTKPGKKQLQQLLTESLFNPDDIGPLKIVADMRDSRYFEMRAIELIKEAGATEKAIDYHDRMKTAISLLALARAEREHGAAKT